MGIPNYDYVQLEIPNRQVLDSADQFYDGAMHLKELPPFSGILLPKLTSAALAIELYAKSLNTWRVIPNNEDFGNGVSGGEVKGEPKSRGHKISKILEDYDTDLVENINDLHSEGKLPVNHLGLIERLKTYDNFLTEIRYSYENDSVRKVNLEDLWAALELIRLVVQKVNPILKPIK